MVSSCCSSVGAGLAQHERVDDGQPPRLTQGGVHGSSTHHVVVPLQLSLSR